MDTNEKKYVSLIAPTMVETKYSEEKNGIALIGEPGDLLAALDELRSKLNIAETTLKDNIRTEREDRNLRISVINILVELGILKKGTDDK